MKIIILLFSCRNVESEPPWGKNLEAELPPGRMFVQFTAKSSNSNQTSSCTVQINVRGKRVHLVSTYASY